MHIEDGIKLPARVGVKRSVFYKTPLLALDVGQSFVINLDDPLFEGIKVPQAAASFAHYRGIRIAVRTIEDGRKIRIWRVL